MYQFQEFPKWIFSELKKEMLIVKDAAEELFHTTPAPTEPPVRKPVAYTETIKESVKAADAAAPGGPRIERR